MSLVCIDELKLLKDIERLINSSIPKDVITGYEPDPSIKAEPIQKGRGQQKAGKAKTALNKSDSRRNKRNNSNRRAA